MPLHKRISLLNECIKVCNVLTKDTKAGYYAKIDTNVANRAYKRVVEDAAGRERDRIDIHFYTKNFPTALQDAIQLNGFIDEWAYKVNFDATIPLNNKCDESHQKRKSDSLHEEANPDFCIKTFTYQKENEVEQSSFWFVSINNSFSDSFWVEWIAALDQMRFCIGLGGKTNAYVQCSSPEVGAVFTTAGKFTYEALPCTIMEDKILSLARFVMSFQKAYIERLYGSDYLVTWDANLLHNVVGPITEAVYGAHNDYSALLCSPATDIYKHVDRDVYLPIRDSMQVLTIHYSNYENNGAPCTSISYFHDKNRIGSTKLGAKGIHIQGPGSQSMGIKHEVKVLDDAHRAGIYRCICTTRLSVVPRHGINFGDSLNNGRNESCRTSSQNYRDILTHDQKNVVSKSNSKTGNGLYDHAVTFQETIATKHLTNDSLCVLMNNEKTTDASPNKRRHLQEEGQDEGQNSVSPAIIEDPFKTFRFSTLKYTECYPNVTNQIYDTYNIKRYMPQISVKDRVRQLTTSPALLCLLRRGYKVYIKQSDGKLYPCLYETISDDGYKLLTYGHRYPSASVCADAGLKHKDRVHVPIHSSELSQNIIILTHRYKQCPNKIDAVITALNRYNNDTYPATFDMGLGEFDGRISIMGSGGSNKVLGNFAPTTKSRKDDPLIVVGMGQKRTNRINKKLDELVANNSVRAIFLNERYYGRNAEDGGVTPHRPNVLRFLGNYQFDESRFVSGDKPQDVAAEFNDPSPFARENLTFRLHPHLRIEANPFIPSLEEVHHVTSENSFDYKRIIINHDDHSPIFYNIPCIDDWRKVNHTLTITDVIDDMIKSGEMNKHIEVFTVNNLDGLCRNSYHYNIQRRSSMENEEKQSSAGSVEVQEDDASDQSGPDDAEHDHRESVQDIDAEGSSDQDSNTEDNSDSSMENVEKQSSAGSVDEQEDDPSDQSGSDYAEHDHRESVQDIEAEDSSDQDSNTEDNSVSEYEFDDDDEDDDGSDVTDCSSSKSVAAGCNVHRERTKAETCGTVASVADIVNCCLFSSAVCSMRYNQRGLQSVRRRLCAMPLKDTSLGTCLRIKPIPSPNRTLDVNLCYLRYTFMEHEELSTSISLNKRCRVSDVRIELLREMMFQTILLRYTGRVYCFEEYRLFLTENTSSTEGRHKRGLPLCEECDSFLDYVKIHMKCKKRSGLNGWMSKQHYGAIANDLKDCYKSFRAFVQNIAKNIGHTVQHMMTHVNTATSGQRALAIGDLQSLLEDSMQFGSVHDYGRVKWMSYIIICDIEEFLVDPFGIIDDSTIAKGNYSLHGHDMINRANETRVPFPRCINDIVSYVYHKTPEQHLRILGFGKTDDAVHNIVNGRPFSGVDAEHFLCKAWIVASSTFGNSRLSKYPRLCNAHTHPSPVIHAIGEKVTDDAMKQMEIDYWACRSLPDSGGLIIPKLCLMPGEEETLTNPVTEI
jgi:hypothetical protein